jgi:hypothetical protein
VAIDEEGLRRMLWQSPTYSFTIDQSLLAGIVMAAFAAVACVFMAYGVLLLTHRLDGTRFVNSRQLQNELRAWSADAPLTANQQDALIRQMTALTGWAILGYGLGLLLAISATSALALRATGSLASLMASGAYVMTIVEFLGMALGFTLGYLVGVGRATRRLPPGDQAWGDLRVRRPRDYRAPWVAWTPALIMLCSAEPLWLLATQTTHVTLTLCGQTWTYPTGPTLSVFITLGALTLAVAGLCVRWLAESRRTLLAAEPQAARGADDLQRAVGIGTILGLTWMSSGELLQAAMSMATTSGAGAHQPWTAPLLSILYLVGVAANIGGLILFALRGRLGGQLTGWRRFQVAPTAESVRT